MSKYRSSRSGRKIYLTLYDKYAQTKDEKYKNILRIEQKICTYKEICRMLKILKNDLYTVLFSEHNPIKTTLEAIFKSIDMSYKKPLSFNNFDLRLYVKNVA